MLTINVKKFQNTSRNTDVGPKALRSKAIGKRARYKMANSEQTYARKISRTGRPIEEGYEVRRIIVLHPTKGFRDRRI